MRLYYLEWTPYIIRQKRSATCNRRFPGPPRIVDTNGISIASAVFAKVTKWQTDWQTDRPRYSVGNNRRSAQWRSQILLLSMATTRIYWSSRLKYTMPAFIHITIVLKHQNSNQSIASVGQLCCTNSLFSHYSCRHPHCIGQLRWNLACACVCACVHKFLACSASF